MSHVEIIIRLALGLVENFLNIEFKDVPEDRQEVIHQTATAELIEWLRSKDFTDRERVLTTFYITAATLHALIEQLPKYKEHLKEQLAKEN